MLFISLKQLRCLILFTVAMTTTSSNEECQIGENLDYSALNTVSKVIPTYSANQIYLNLENPATCTGLVYNITFCVLRTQTGTYNEGTFSIWKPMEDLDNYMEVTSSISTIQNYNDGCTDHYRLRIDFNPENANEAQSLFCRKRCFDNPIKVKPGYVLGVQIASYVADGYSVIAEKDNQDVGICISNGIVQNSDGSIQFDCDTEYVNRTLLLEADVYPIYCHKLTPPVNGNINNTNNSYTTTVSFNCNEHYFISNSLVLTCLENGRWNNNVLGELWNQHVPACILIDCSNPGIPTHGSNSDIDPLYFTNGSLLTFQCDNGYYLDGPSVIQCSEGQWSSGIPKCLLITCPSLDSPQNGNFEDSNNDIFSFNMTVKFYCNYDYSLTNKYPLICLPNGTWNSSIPECTITNTGSLSETYKFLIFGVILLLFVILFSAIFILLAILIRKNQSSLALRSSRSSDSLKEQLIKDGDGYDISPYSAVNMPPGEIYVSTQNGMAYFTRPISPVPFSSGNRTSVLSTISSNTSASSTTPSGALIPKYITPAVFSSQPLIPTMIQELEQSLKSEHPYWNPAEMEEDIYFQLNTLKVKTIPSEQLRLLNELGEGEFAMVCKGILLTEEEEINVAVKSSKSTLLTQEDKVHFLKEAAIMGQFHHSNVLRLFGVVVDKPENIMIVVELMENGDLLNYLQVLKTRDNRDKLPFQLLNFSRQICLGMTYLSGKGFIHRDLAARNIFVSSDGLCKIADFGMSHDLKEESYYFVHEGSVVPVKWTAPEGIRDRKYSTASDVWSYGCVLYEIWSLGCKPFKGASAVNAIKILKTGQRLTPPPGCPREIYHTMIKTWHPVPGRRPNFNEIMLSMIRSDEDILFMPDEAISTHLNASLLGADLQAGVNMYRDLQDKYLK